jgi:hypothetical protein
MSEEKIEEAEKETLQKIVLALPNDAQALRHIENYGNWRVKDLYSEEEVEDIVNKTVDKFCTFFSSELKQEVAKEWFEQNKKK